MKPTEDIKLLEVLFVEMDPLEDGFAGMLVEIHCHGDRYVLLETAQPPAIASSGSPPKTKS